MVPLSGGAANGGVLNTGYVKVATGDCLMLSGLQDRGIADECYMVFSNGVARHDHPACSHKEHLYFPFSFVEDR